MPGSRTRTAAVSKYLAARFTDMSEVPFDLRVQIERLDEEKEQRSGSGIKRAVFDLDNTLIVGDVGEAVFALLLSEGRSLGLTWSQYETMKRVDPPRAFIDVVTAMRGLRVEEVVQATIRVMSFKGRSIRVDGASVSVPFPHPVMRGLIQLLHRKSYAVYVITASSQDAARIVCSEWFDIPEERVFGIRQARNGEILTDDVKVPVPIGSGKADVYRLFIGSDPPRISGTDSTYDLPLLDLTDDDGLVIWLGRRERCEIIGMSLSKQVTTYPVFPSTHRALAGAQLFPS